MELLSPRERPVLIARLFHNHFFGGTDAPEIKITDFFNCKLIKKLSSARGGGEH